MSSQARPHWLSLCQPVFKHRDPAKLAAMIEKATDATATKKNPQPRSHAQSRKFAPPGQWSRDK